MMKIDPILASNYETEATARKLSEQVHSARNEEAGKSQEPVSEARVESAVQIANDIMKMVDARYEFSIDKSTNIGITKVINKENGETIRQYPPEEIVSMVNKMYDMLGFFVDKKI